MPGPHGGFDGSVYANSFESNCIEFTCPTNQVKQAMRAAGRGLHSSTSQLIRAIFFTETA